jgi:hypothetical protein
MILQDRLSVADIVRPVFTAARGAVLCARPRQETPFSCVEPGGCIQNKPNGLGMEPPVKEDLK